jgi:hypothetical protein
MDVSGSPVRNRRAACRNRAAPSLAAARAPPSRSAKATSACAPAFSLLASVARASTARRGSVTELLRAASTLKLENVARMDGPVAPAGVTMARCRCRPNRSRKRAPSPAAHRRMVRLHTPSRRATCLIDWPRRTSPTDRKMTSTPVTFPGSASQGRARSRAPHFKQTANATPSTVKRLPAWSLRSTRRPVRRTSVPPHRWQQHPRRSSPPRLAIASV